MHIYSPSIQSENYLNLQHQRAPSNFSGISHLSASSSLITPSTFEDQLYLKKVVREERTYLTDSPFASPNKKTVELNTRGLHSTQRKVYLGTRSLASSQTISPQIRLLKGTPSVKRNLLHF